MKAGNVVKLHPLRRWLTPDEHEKTGIIIRSLDGGSHRKNISHEVMWSDSNISWHVQQNLRIIR